MLVGSHLVGGRLRSLLSTVTSCGISPVRGR